VANALPRARSTGCDPEQEPGRGRLLDTLANVPFRAVDRELDLVALETRVLRRWTDDDVFAESLRRREGAPEWVFYEGPPTANGRPGLHHVWARSFKDLFPRFHTMRGRYVPRKGGWDCHGLPVELEVEKELGFSGKQQIEEFGIAEFNRRCRESVTRYVEDWSALTARIGMWIDTADAYWTLDRSYIESVWWHLKTMWDRELLYEGFKVVPYCGRCGTALSSHEVAQGYEDVTEPSVYVRFPVVDRDFDLLVWTTTPWTLLSNVAVAVGPDVRYVRAQSGEGRDLVLAAERVASVLGDEVAIIGDVPVNELVGLHYRRPFDVLPIDDAAARIVADAFVTVEDGSGIVHLAPAFGEIDREVAAREGLPILNPVDAAARFDASVPQHAGQFVKDADPAIIDDLTARGILLRAIDSTHSYPHCWRCGTPLIYWAKPTWFARTSEHRDELLRENETIGWHPEHIKHGRFGKWLEGNVDWALSRDRFWGTPLPIWRCTECAHDTCVGSVAELAELAGRALDDLDLHRPDVDEVAIACPECGGRACRVEPVLDAWFDSGAMPGSQLHYPFEHEDVFERRFPADFICEAIDQTRGWFYSLLAVNTLVFDRTPYKNVVCLALLVDKDGFKMSKSRGNIIDPWTILDTRGADALRWYFFSAGSPWTSRRVDEQTIDESTRRFLVTLWNTYSFFVTYATLDGWSPEGEGANPPVRHVLDRWVRSRLHTTVRDVTDALEGFDAMRAAQALESFVDDLSNWYVRRSRPRFWKSADPAAHATLHECLRTVALLLAPLCPFVSDEMYTNLDRHGDVDGESVHLGDWPEADLAAIDAELEAAVATARQVVTLGRAARTEAKLRVRQPLPRALVLLPGGAELTPELVDEVADELNVKQVEPILDLGGLLDHTVVPNFRALGPRVGPLMPEVKARLAATDGATVSDALERDGVYRLEVDGQTVELGPDDVEVRAVAHQELVLAEGGGYAVALDTVVDHTLRLEGVAREVVRAINDLRKALDLALSDRIGVALHADGVVYEAARTHGDWIADEVLADRWGVEPRADAPSNAHALELDGEPIAVSLEVIAPR
jgi:isoleucyl-tRNA synthetase